MAQANPFAGHALPNPDLSPAEAAAVLEAHFGRRGALLPLGSTQDQNFRVDAPDGRFVLRIETAQAVPLYVEAQNAAMLHLAGASFEVPVPQPTLEGGFLAAVERDGARHLVRLLSFVEGVPLSEAGHLASPVLRDLGALAARCARALADFTHPGAERLLQWDCRHAGDVVRALAGEVADPAARERALAAAEEAEAALAPVRGDLRTQVIHGDVTDWNTVARPDAAGRLRPVGVIDFGDVLVSWLVAELAVAVHAAVPHEPGRPLQTAMELTRAFTAELPLADAELEALWPLVVARAAVVAVSVDAQLGLAPENAFVEASREQEWRTLEAVAAIPAALAHEALRAAAGAGPSPRAGAAARALAAAGAGSPVVELGAAPLPLDLSVTGDELAPGAWERPEALAALVAARPGAVGRHGEGRLVHAGRAGADEPASVHLGVDLFAPPGAAVRAPLPATVAAVGATELVLRGEGFDVRLAGVAAAVAPGAAVGAGATIGAVAAPAPGAALPAHVHVQVVAAPGLDAPGLAPGSLAGPWLALCPDPSPLLGLPPGLAAAAPGAPAALLARREEALAAVQEHYYAEPPQIERGWRAQLYDTTGRPYLDVINNVAVLGHSHPGVEAAVSRQLRRLNTNSRFHYEVMVAFAERLAGLLPAPLERVFLVSTGSEAGDLALRLVRAATGRRDVLALRGAYHGWTTATDEVSTSALDNPRAAESRPPWIHVVAAPDTYRGAHRGPDAGARYAEELGAELATMAAAGTPPAGFIAEAVYGNAGGVLLPPGYLADAYARVRAAGGLCIADEVQVGYGRLGEHFWGFEQQGAVPDVVTVAKAMGNGVPVGAVITTRAVAEAFAAEGSFFSSVGGSPMSSAAGLAVLDALEGEGLQENARAVGSELRARLEDLVERHPICGAVHGMGLYLGLDLVRDRETREPATAAAFAICERMRELGVIVQPTGDGENVLKIKPPLCLTRAEAERFVATLDRVLAEGW
jgi:4-aminobutyrate aminotransferase-like enzyme/Ser/Thr protein kinase RdoA (MazF antagonist)